MLHATTSALCYSLAAHHAGAHPALGAPYNDVTEFVAAQRDRAGALLRVPLRIATLAFALAGLRYGGAPFHRLPVEARRRQVAAWRTSWLGPCRELIRFHESLALLPLFARAGMQAAPDSPPAPPAPEPEPEPSTPPDRAA